MTKKAIKRNAETEREKGREKDERNKRKDKKRQ